MTKDTSSLKDVLSAALPEGFRCKLRYVYTPPKRCDPIFSTPQGFEPELTRLASHFLTISINSGLDGSKDASDVFVLAIEALIYTTKRLTTIFISKADSTGYLPKQTPSAARTIITTFIDWLATDQILSHPTRKFVISLFARSQSQYLFPGSAENVKKHILDDRQLIKWWTRVLDPIIPKQEQPRVLGEAQKVQCNGFITVPSYEGISELRAFLPPHVNAIDTALPRWTPGDPLHKLAEARGLPVGTPARCLLPRFPDDPKARFIRDLDDEAGLSEDTILTSSPKKGRGGKWTTIQDIPRFWEAMSFRQECSSGRVVGFIWVLMWPQSNSLDESMKQSAEESQSSIFSNDPISQEEVPSAMIKSPPKRRRKPLSGPIIGRQPRLKGGSSSLTASDLSGMLNTENGTGLVLTQAGYDKALQSLLHLDFANIEVATQSTSRWMSEVSYMCGVQSDWALDIIGTNKVEVEDASRNGMAQVKQVNDLGGMVRKKRKAEDQTVDGSTCAGETQTHSAGNGQPAVNVLGAGMVRKKPKPVVT